MSSSPVATVSPQAEATESAILLAEVMFSPTEGESAFVELANVTDAAVDLGALRVTLDGMELELSEAGSTLGPGELLLITLDGDARVDGQTIHPGSEYALSPSTGAVELVDPNDVVLDRVAWGDDPYAVRLSRGAILPDAVELGSTIGRPPGALAPDDRTQWVLYEPAEASPGEANPLPRVAILLPLDGAMFDGPTASLAWYPVTEASSYRVQVAEDESFDGPVVDAEVTEPKAETGPLPAGAYVWRVASIAANGTAAGFSEPSSFEIGDASGSVWLASAVESSPGAQTIQTASSNPLAVPMIYQHKDTPMLLLERPQQTGRHAWDLDHGVVDLNDPADNMNCVLASIAMISFYSGGNLNQDRIGYELFKARAPGPERDLDYDDALSRAQTRLAFEFAFSGATPTVTHPPSIDDLWSVITASIDRGVPLMSVRQIAPTRTHAFVVIGYSSDARGDQFFRVNDPITGPQTVRLDTRLGGGRGWEIWQLGAASRARIQEPTVHMDTDGDGVVDFDEIARFHTDPNLGDTDADDVLDKEDIAASVFDARYGYAAHPSRGARDFDSDGQPIELDPDADDGGCEDGREDTDLNGARNGRETWNFEAADDRCDDPGNWTLVLGGGPVPGSYGGSDELICVAGDNGPWSVAFNPIGADPVLHVAATSAATGDSILVGIAGGVEGPGDYLASDEVGLGSAGLLGPVTIDDGIMHMSIRGSVPYPGEDIPRTMLLTVECPLFQ